MVPDMATALTEVKGVQHVPSPWGSLQVAKHKIQPALQTTGAAEAMGSGAFHTNKSKREAPLLCTLGAGT